MFLAAKVSIMPRDGAPKYARIDIARSRRSPKAKHPPRVKQSPRCRVAVVGGLGCRVGEFCVDRPQAPRPWAIFRR
eukprot:469847-Prymnesium_polylepis.1